MSITAEPRSPSPFTATLLSVTLVFLFLATGAIGIRIYLARASSGRNWLTNDLVVIIAALIVIYGCIITSIIGTAMVGLNYVSNRLSVGASGEFSFKVIFVDIITTITASGLCKISILEFYKRIFVPKYVQISCNIFIFLVSVWVISVFFLQIFSTTPISSAWDPELQKLDANYNYIDFLLAVAGIGIVLDVSILCLPLRPIWELQLKWQSKIKVFLILWLGIFCVVCASLRFYWGFKQFRGVFEATAEEKAFTVVNTLLWWMLEPTASIIAACLPAYGPLINSRGMTMLLKSARSIFSIQPITRGRSGRVTDTDAPNHSWHELGPTAHQERADVKTDSVQDLTRVKIHDRNYK